MKKAPAIEAKISDDCLKMKNDVIELTKKEKLASVARRHALNKLISLCPHEFTILFFDEHYERTVCLVCGSNYASNAPAIDRDSTVLAHDPIGALPSSYETNDVFINNYVITIPFEKIIKYVTHHCKINKANYNRYKKNKSRRL